MLVHQRLAAADRDDRRARFLGRMQRLVQRHHVANRLLVLDDSPASDARKVARMQRLEHQHQRKIVLARTLLRAYVAAQIDHLSRRNAHTRAFSWDVEKSEKSENFRRPARRHPPLKMTPAVPRTATR